MNKLIILISLFTIVFVTIKWTKAIFTTSAINPNNSVIASLAFPTGNVTPTPTGVLPNIVINETLPEASNSSEWVELYNPTATPIDLSGWSITDNLATDTFPATISAIPANGYGIIVANPTNIVVPAGVIKIQLSSAIGDGLTAGSDKLILKNKNNIVIDQLGWGSNHDIFNPAPAAPSNGLTLARHPNGKDTDTSSDWISTASATLGSANP